MCETTTMLIDPESHLLIYKYLNPCRTARFYDFRVGHHEIDGVVSPMFFVRSLDTATHTATFRPDIDPDSEIDLLRPLDTYNPLSCDQCLILGLKYRLGEVTCKLHCPHLFAEYYNPVTRGWSAIQPDDDEESIAVRLLLECEASLAAGDTNLKVSPNRDWFTREIQHPGCIRSAFMATVDLCDTDHMFTPLDLPVSSPHGPTPSYP